MLKLFFPKTNKHYILASEKNYKETKIWNIGYQKRRD